MLEEEALGLQQPAEETERCRDYVVTKAAFVRKTNKKKKEDDDGKDLIYASFCMTCWAFVDFFFPLFSWIKLYKHWKEKQNHWIFFFLLFPKWDPGMTLELETFAAENVVVLEGTTSVYLDARHRISPSAIVERYSTFWHWTCSRPSLLVTFGELHAGWDAAESDPAFTSAPDAAGAWIKELEQHIEKKKKKKQSGSFLSILNCWESISTDLDWFGLYSSPQYRPVNLMGLADWPEMWGNAWCFSYSSHWLHQKMGCGASGFKTKANMKAP